VAVDQKVYDSIVYIAENVRAENDVVNTAYFDAIKSNVDVQGAMDAIGDDLEADFEDVA
jgi:hypothetical protein